ncbi:MAG: hypothetical protein RIB65_15040 [Ilumatobacter fluminis]|uniref:CHAT domain-containing protein n=1 Tax=Ilumatobacter fluminis TaxID=467091 RepID=UPI0032EF3362
MTQGTRWARFTCLAAAAILIVSACSGGDDAGSDQPDETDATESVGNTAEPGEGDDSDDESTSTTAATDSQTEDQSDESDEPVEVPTVSELTTCGAADHPCTWAEAATEALEATFAIGEAAQASYGGGADLFAVADEIAGTDDIAGVLVSGDAIWFRVDGGMGAWFFGDGALGTRSTRSASPARSDTAAVTRPLPRDVVGDDHETKRALVLSPYQFDFAETDEGAAVAALYEGARGYAGNVEYYENTDTETGVGVALFEGWDAYDVVHVSTHGQQICDESGCVTSLLVDSEVTMQVLVLDENGGATVGFNRNGADRLVDNSFLAEHYPDGLPDTVVVLSACETGRGEDLTNAFGDGVVFSWTEAVDSAFAQASSLALHGTLIETGSTTERAHSVVGDADLVSYDDVADPDTPEEPGEILVLGSDGRFHYVTGADVGGSEATSDGNGPEIEALDRPDTPEEGGEITVTLVRRGGGSGDLRVREVAWIDHPQDGGEMQPGAEVRVDIRDDADYMPVALRVEGLDPGTEADTTLRLEVDGIEVDTWSASEGDPTGKWGEWLIEDDVRLLNRIEEDDEVEMKLTIELPESGQSIDEIAPVKLTCLTGVWRLRSQEFFEEIVRVTGGGAGLQIAHRSGEYTVTLRSDGTYTGRRNQWQFGSSTPQGTLVTTIDSTDPGTWSSSGNQLTISDPGSPATVTIQLEVGGQLQNLPFGVGNQTVGSEAIAGTGTFTCEDQVLTTTYEGVTATFDFVGPAE